jgi:hypothetical protein
VQAADKPVDIVGRQTALSLLDAAQRGLPDAARLESLGPPSPWRRGAAPTQRLSRNEVSALKFAAHRQLTRWAKSSDLRPRQREQRSALVRAVRILEHPAFADGCELRPFSTD